MAFAYVGITFRLQILLVNLPQGGRKDRLSPKPDYLFTTLTTTQQPLNFTTLLQDRIDYKTS